MKLWLVRHARPLIAPGLCYGATDVAADAAETALAAQRLAQCLPPGAPVRVSGLRRAGQLADALARLRPDLHPRTDLRLNEMDFGQWEGQAWTQIPRVAIDAWTADFANERFGGRESTQEVLNRVAAALADTLRERQAGADAAPAVWLTHAGVIRAVACLLRHGRQSPVRADQWPREAPAWGQWQVLDVQSLTSD